MGLGEVSALLTYIVVFSYWESFYLMLFQGDAYPVPLVFRTHLVLLLHSLITCHLYLCACEKERC